MFITVYFNINEKLIKYRATNNAPLIHDKTLQVGESNNQGWILLTICQYYEGKFIPSRKMWNNIENPSLKHRFKRYLIRKLEK